MPAFRLWIERTNETKHTHAATREDALANFSAAMGLKLSFDGPDVVPNYLFQGPMPEEAHWVSPPDTPVFEIE